METVHVYYEYNCIKRLYFKISQQEYENIYHLFYEDKYNNPTYYLKHLAFQPYFFSL